MPPPADSSSEFAFINWVRGRTQPHPWIPVGPGDDTAVVDLTNGLTLVTTDMLLEGSCFRLAEAGPRRGGGQGMAGNPRGIPPKAGETVPPGLNRGVSPQRRRA